MLGELGFSHTTKGLSEFLDWLVGLNDGEVETIAIALERPHGAVVDCLLERRFSVYAINPKQVDRFRDRYSVSGAKDDRRDAFVLADALRKDFPRFQRVHTLEPELIQLRELLRTDEELCKEEVALANRIREQLLRCVPHVLSLAPDNLISPFFWDVVERFVIPSSPVEASKKTIEGILRQHRIRRFSSREVVELLQQPPLPAAEGTREAAFAHLKLLVERVRFTYQQRKAVQKQLDFLLHELLDPRSPDTARPTDAAILHSIPGVGRIVLATVLTSAADVVRRRDIDSLRTLSGIAPVTRSSGTWRRVSMRMARNRALNHAMYHWARNAIKKDPHFREHYSRLRTKGHRHCRALRGVMDRILSIAIAMLDARQLYQPSRHKARQSPMSPQRNDLDLDKT
jgi:transposase